MERYRILPHTADGKFRAFGASIEEAFANAALAMVSLMWDWTNVEPRQSLAVEIEGRDPEQLLLKFLEEILYVYATKNFVLGKVDGLKIERSPDGFKLAAVFSGVEGPGGIEFYGDVKAVTYSEMKIERGCDGWAVQVVVDM